MKAIPYLLLFFPMLCFAQLKIELKNIEHNKCDGDGHLAVEVTGGSGMYQYSCRRHRKSSMDARI